MPDSPSRTYGVIGFLCGLLSILVPLVEMLFMRIEGIFLGAGLGILGIVMSGIQLHRHRTGWAIAGLVLSILGTIGCFLLLAIGATLGSIMSRAT